MNPFEKQREHVRITELLKERDGLRNKVNQLGKDLDTCRMYSTGLEGVIRHLELKYRNLKISSKKRENRLKRFKIFTNRL